MQIIYGAVELIISTTFSNISSLSSHEGFNGGGSRSTWRKATIFSKKTGE